jgi:hypothetical protein
MAAKKIDAIRSLKRSQRKDLTVYYAHYTIMAASASAASASPMNATAATSATTPQLWMEICLTTQHPVIGVVGHIYFDKGSNQISYMLEKNENWSPEWRTMYEDQYITVNLHRPAHLVTCREVINSIIDQSPHFNNEVTDHEDVMHGLNFDMLFSMTFSQYQAITHNPDIARFIMMINDEAAIAIDEADTRYRKLKATSKEKQQQLTNEIAIAKQRIIDLNTTLSELESPVKTPTHKMLAKSWMYKGHQYYRDSDNTVWRQAIGGCELVGRYIEEEDRIEEDHSDDTEDSEDSHDES